MKTMTQTSAGRDAPAFATAPLFPSARRVRYSRSGWPSHVRLSREAASATVWAVFPAVLGGAIEGLTEGRPCFAVLAVIAHQLIALVLGSRDDGCRISWGAAEWAILAAGAALTVAIADPVLWPWLLVPIAPALLLRAARRGQLFSRIAGLIRVFSVATLGAVLVQLSAATPSAGVAVAVLGGTVLYLAGIERLATGGCP